MTFAEIHFIAIDSSDTHVSEMIFLLQDSNRNSAFPFILFSFSIGGFPVSSQVSTRISRNRNVKKRYPFPLMIVKLRWRDRTISVVVYLIPLRRWRSEGERNKTAAITRASGIRFLTEKAGSRRGVSNNRVRDSRSAPIRVIPYGPG